MNDQEYYAHLDAQAEYEAGLAAQAQAQAEYEEQMAYEEYLGNLLETKEYKLFALEVVLDMLNSKDFIASNLPAKEYLDNKRHKLYLHLQTKNNPNPELPF